MATESIITSVVETEYRAPAVRPEPKPQPRRASSKYDNAEILREAHRHAKALMAPRDIPGRHHVLDRKIAKFVPTFSYRQAFAGALIWCWQEAKQALRLAAVNARVEARITPENKMKIRELLAWQGRLPITESGNAEYRQVSTEIHLLTWGY